jgi:hypothetical protein
MNFGEPSGFVANLKARLQRFTTDVRRRPILGLYFVIGVMVVSYVVYLLVSIAKDLTDANREHATARPATEKVQEAPGGRGTGRGGAEQPPPVGAGQAGSQDTKVQGSVSPGAGTESPGQTPSAPPIQPQTSKTAPEGVDARDLRSYDFPDGRQILFPGTWKDTKVPAQQGVLEGIRLEVPGADASIQVYARRREPGEDLAKTLRATMNQQGARNIEEKRKQIKEFSALELTGTIADKQMAITIFDHDSQTYVVATLIATTKDYPQQRSHYDAVLNTYSTPQSRNQRGSVSVRDLEQSIRQGLQKPEEGVVGKMVELILVNGKTQKGVVLAEDETTYTLENYRFGGRYSFKVQKKDVAKINR